MNSIRPVFAAIQRHILYWKEIYVFPPLSFLLLVIAYYIVPFLSGRRATDDPAAIVGDCLNLAGLMLRVTAAGLIMSHIIGYSCEKLPPPQNVTDHTFRLLYSIRDSLCVLFVLWLVFRYQPA